MKAKWKVGIDPGVKTGIGVWRSGHEDENGKYVNGQLVEVTSMTITKAMKKLLEEYPPGETKLFIEDARKWIGFAGKATKKSQSVIQGAGSIKRDAKIWEDWCAENGYTDVTFIPPYHGMTMKGSAGRKKFERLTKWTKATNEHGRDAAMLVFGKG